MEPKTPESNFCVIDGRDDKVRPMLERVAGELVPATEAFPKEDTERVVTGRRTAYASLIVTTAKITVATFDAASVALADGKVNALNYIVASLESAVLCQMLDEQTTRHPL